MFNKPIAQLIQLWHTEPNLDKPEPNRDGGKILDLRFQIYDFPNRSTERSRRSPNSQIRNWQLTTAERRRILLNNIYGVDIDPQAVEVTKLSLLLKVLEGESEQTIVKQLKMFHERALPDLGNNIGIENK